MKFRILQRWIAGLLIMSGLAAPAATHYLVPENSNAESPFTTWSSAGTSVIDVVNAALADAASPRLVLVSNGVYTLTNAVPAITKDVVIRSVNGRDAVRIDGDGQWRCFSLKHSNCVLDGLTLSNGYTSSGGGGGGVYIQNGTVSNCVITDCVNSNTDARHGGGGIRISGGLGVVANSIISRNRKYLGDQGGGGIALENTSTSRIENCVIEGNNTFVGHGGGIYVGYDLNYGQPLAEIRNCLIRGNATMTSSSYYGGGIMLGYAVSNRLLIENCTIVCNTGRWVGGISFLNGADKITNALIRNCIVVSNWGQDYPNIGGVGTNAAAYTCSTPGTHFKLINGNISNAPVFVDPAAGDYHIQRSSPCINTGTNQAGWMAGARDLDGRSRLDPFSRQVDMGCYEYLPSGALYLGQ